MNRLVNLNNVDLNKVLVFCRIVDAGSYRLASEQLNVTPSALSQTISSLEHSLGTALFNRVGKRLVPTHEGSCLHREFKSSHSGFISALSSALERQSKISGLLTIGAYQEFAKSRLAPIVSGFLNTHPEARIKLVFEQPSRLHRMLELGQIDSCFSIFPAVERSSIVSTPVYSEELVLIAPRGLISEKPAFAEFCAVPMVEYYFNHQPIRRWIALHFNRRPRALPIRAYAATAEMVLALVKSGLGVGIVPRYLIPLSERPSLIRLIRPTPKRFVESIWMLEPKSRGSGKTTPLQAAFSKHALESFRASAGESSKRGDERLFRV